jgi:UPF0755 protein
MKIKTKLSFLFITLALLAFAAFFVYQKIFHSNVEKDAIVYIKTGSEFEDVLKVLEPYLKNKDSFLLLSKKMKYIHVKPGRYEIKSGMNNVELIRMLRAGLQKPIKISFNNQETLEKLAGRLAQQLEPDSLQFLEIMKDEKFLSENGFDRAHAISLFIPNSYEFYWNISADKFREKMLKEYQKFWNEDRKAKAQKQNLTPLEVSTLASIVQKETATVSERKTVAGLYLNRLNDHMLLQSDPTVIYAQKLEYGQDLVIKRVLNKHLEIDSKYNTYKYEGLPPGPIAMPDISSIEAVLNPEKHEYYYMCASVTDFGKHAFAKTLAQHNVNAAKYQKWVAEQGY